MKTTLHRVTLAAAILSSTLILGASGVPIGDIKVVYNASNPFGISASLDAPAFVIENTSAIAITNGVLSIGVGGDNAIADSFNVGTIAANSFVVIVPGLSNDGGAGHTFFAFTGSERDTSDVGPSGDGVPFSFSGLLGVLNVSSGIFTPAATRGPTNDGTIASMNFLGGPGNNDGPCGNCFGPTKVADLNILSTVPEQGCTFTLLLIALVGCALFHWRSTGRLA